MEYGVGTLQRVENGQGLQQVDLQKAAPQRCWPDAIDAKYAMSMFQQLGDGGLCQSAGRTGDDDFLEGHRWLAFCWIEVENVRLPIGAANSSIFDPEVFHEPLATDDGPSGLAVPDCISLEFDPRAGGIR